MPTAVPVNARLVKIDDIEMRLFEWCKEYGISQACVLHRVNKQGWDWERAITTPVRKYKDNLERAAAAVAAEPEPEPEPIVEEPPLKLKPWEKTCKWKPGDLEREPKWHATRRLKAEGRYEDFRKAKWRLLKGGIDRDTAFYRALADFAPLETVAN
jgi:hypothetical protein